MSNYSIPLSICTIQYSEGYQETNREIPKKDIFDIYSEILLTKHIKCIFSTLINPNIKRVLSCHSFNINYKVSCFLQILKFFWLSAITFFLIFQFSTNGFLYIDSQSNTQCNCYERAKFSYSWKKCGSSREMEVIGVLIFHLR